MTQNVLASRVQGHTALLGEKQLPGTDLIGCGEGSVVQAGSEIPDHLQDLVVGDGGVYFLVGSGGGRAGVGLGSQREDVQSLHQADVPELASPSAPAAGAGASPSSHAASPPPSRNLTSSLLP